MVRFGTWEMTDYLDKLYGALTLLPIIMHTFMKQDTSDI